MGNRFKALAEVLKETWPFFIWRLVRLQNSLREMITEAETLITFGKLRRMSTLCVPA